MRRSLLVLGLGLATLQLGCAGSTAAEATLDRCQEDLNLGQLIVETIGGAGQATPPTSTGVHIAGEVFDTEQESTVTLGDPAAFFSRLCDAVLVKVRTRCEVASSAPNAQACGGRTSSIRGQTTPAQKITRRPTQGRYNLSLESFPDGRARIVLNATEWVQ